MKSLYNRIIGTSARLVRDYRTMVAAALLTTMFGLGLTSMVGNSAIIDEIAHVSAAYTYLHYADYRLNPEHPPLMKDLAGLPLQFMHLKYPVSDATWTNDVNGQWESGWTFIYHIGNNADSILFWARLPILLTAIAFGVFLYAVCRRRWGTGVALLALFFYCFSPNLIAHSTLVTTDLGASAFSFVALATFARFIDRPSRSNLLLLSLALAAAQLAKFSSVLLYPFCFFIVLVYITTMSRSKPWSERFKTFVGGFLAASGLSVAWIWLWYIPQTWNMPVAVQDRLISGVLTTDTLRPIGQVLTQLNDIVVFKSIAQYVLGLAMVYGRVQGGNVTYFNGQVSDQSFRLYFPQLFVMKTQLALLVLMVGLSGYFLWRALRRPEVRGRATGLYRRFERHFREHVLEWSLGGFAVFYFWVSVLGNLNLGIRHILPVYVPIFVLVAVGVVRGARLVRTPRLRPALAAALAGLLVWYGASTVWVFPSYLAYFNELGGGPAHADRYFTDSSVDWGQDLRRLKTYVDEHPQINHLAVDYFGGGIPAYYFCDRKYDEQGHLIANGSGYDCSHSIYEEWHAQYGKYTGSYIAVSETYLENDIYFSAVNGSEGYGYLRSRQPVAKIGYSIYLYKLD